MRNVTILLNLLVKYSREITKYMMPFYIVFFLIICVVLLMVTIVGKDFYPFSHYPMFSRLNHMNKVKIYRLALEAKNGEIEWWQHEAYRYPQIVGNKLYQLYHK